MREMRTASMVDVLVVGAGPGGLQLAHELRRAGADYLVADAGDAPGSFFRTYPRHRQLISINKRNVGDDQGSPLRYDWNSLLTDDPALSFTRYTDEYFPPADQMVRYLDDFARRQHLAVRHGSPVAAVERTGGPDEGDEHEGHEGHEGFVATVGGDAPTRIHARRVVLATGVVPHLPAIPGIEHAERYADVTIDPAGFRGARVLIVGKGNSAFETASSLIPTAAAIHLASPTPLRFAWATHYVGHLRAVNNELLDSYHLKSGGAVLDAEVTAIRRDGPGYAVDLAYTHAGGQRVTYRYDRVVAATGFRFDASPLGGLAPERCLDGRLPAMTSAFGSPSVPGLHYAGTLMQARDHGKTASGFIHGFRYNARFLAKVLLSPKDVPPDDWLPADRADPDSLARLVLGRLNESDGLFLQPGFLADAFVVDGSGRLGFHADVPLEWVREGGLGHGWRLAVTLEYGPPAPDPFIVQRWHDPSYAKVTPYLHPVVRLLDGEAELDRLDLLEDLDNRYRPEVFLPHLAPFLRSALSSAH